MSSVLLLDSYSYKLGIICYLCCYWTAINTPWVLYVICVAIGQLLIQAGYYMLSVLLLDSSINTSWVLYVICVAIGQLICHLCCYWTAYMSSVLLLDIFLLSIL